MPKTLLKAISIGLILLIAPPALAQSTSSHIPYDQILSVFDQVKTRTHWDLDGKLVWGYFFVSDDQSSAEQIAKLLKNKGYEVVNLEQQKDETNPHRSVWRLHVERIEHHTPESLFARNDELYALADQIGHTAYDGMDVGPVR